MTASRYPAWTTLVQQLLFSLALYVLTIVHVSSENWGTPELLWALWTASLTLGGSWIVLSILLQKIPAPQTKNEEGHSPGLLSRIAAAFFLLCFFSFHFGLFHLVHGAFLRALVPLEPWVPPLQTDGFFTAHLMALPRLIVHFAPFLLLCMISQWREYANLFSRIGRPVDGSPGAGMMHPYVMIIRMHLTIIALGFLSMFGASSFWLYFVLIIYFLPLLDMYGTAASWWRLRNES